MPDSAFVRKLDVGAEPSSLVVAVFGQRRWRRPCWCSSFRSGRQPGASSGTVGSDCSGYFSRAGQAFPVLRGVCTEAAVERGLGGGTPGSVADTAYPALARSDRHRAPGTLSGTFTDFETADDWFCSPSPEEKSSLIVPFVPDVTEKKASRAAAVWVVLFSSPPTP